VVLITHDLGVVRHFADRVAVMRRGEIVETGPTEEIFERPQADYTRMLLDAEPSGHKPPVGKEAPVVLAGQNVTIDYVIPGAFLSKSRAFRAVDGVNVSLHQGQTIGIVGESGSGKSTLGRALLRLVTAEGRIFFGKTEITGLGRTAMRPLRRQLQLVFQDPYGSLSPRQTVGEIITEGLFVHDPQLSRAQRDERAIEALKEVGLDPAARNRYPHEFSGGQRQRIAIARAIILKPDVVILDEPTSALDRSIQGQVIDLLRNLQKTHNLSYIFISHDLSVIKAISDYVIVMRNGKIVEEGETDAIFERPAAEYTKTLIKSAFSAEVTS
jgi:oligopeptide transport system ATP-binding protein